MIPVQRHRLGERQRVRHAERFQYAAGRGNKVGVVGCCTRPSRRLLPFGQAGPD
jgi:hypothetical protein